jgi:Domain of unknown function (DUF4157)
MTGHDTPEPTLGERIDAVARVIAERHQVRYPWANSLVPVLRRAALLSESPGDRFERREAPVGQPLPVTPADSGRASGPAPAAASRPGRAGEVSSPAAELPADVRAQLSDIAGPGAGLLRVRADAAADSLSRAYRAEAVTIGADVSFRAGRFRPRETEGFALLAHEAAHVSALLDQDQAWRRAAAGGIGREEDVALAAETTARQRFGQASGGQATAAGTATESPATVPSAQPGPWPGSAISAGSSPAAAVASRPMAASVDRAISQPPPFDVQELRRSLIADLMRQLRSDFERGG